MNKLETTSLPMVNEQRKDDTQDVERSLVEALEHFLYERYLEGYLPKALAWCDEMGARLFEEVAEELETLAQDLALKPFERKRLLGAPRKRDAAGKPVVPAPALEAVSAHSAVAPEITGNAPQPEPEQEQSDDEHPVLPTAPHVAQVRVKNTFIHVEDVAPGLSLLPRGETCPAATTFLIQAALTRLATPLHELPGECGFVTPLAPLETPEPATPCNEPEKVQATVEVPAGRVGALIGKSGATLRRLEQETGAQVSVAKEVRDPGMPKDHQVRAVMVQGTPAAVSAAREAIAAAIADELTKVDDAVVHVERKPKTTSFDIWEAQVSWVVGERGKTVAAIEELSGAVISVPKQGWKRKVVIRGDEEARAKALHLIENKLPYTVTLDVAGAKIGALLGYRGENIRGIEARSWATVSVPREGAMRTVVICGPTQESIDLALLDVEGALQPGLYEKIKCARHQPKPGLYEKIKYGARRHMLTSTN